MNTSATDGGLTLLDRTSSAPATPRDDAGGEPGAAISDGREQRSVPRAAAWAVAAGLSVVLLLLREPLSLAPLALTLATALAVTLASSATPGGSATRLGHFTLVAAVPAGLLFLVISALSVGLLGGLLERPVWGSDGVGAGTVGGVLVLTGLVSWRRGRRIVVIGSDWPALSGAGLLAAFFCWVVATQPFEQWSRGMSTSTDFLRHLQMVRGVGDAGLLEPGVPTYPRAFHATVAWLASALGLGDDSQTLWMATQPLAMLLLVVMLLAVMAIAGRAATLTLVRQPFATAAAAVAGASFVQTAWFSTFLGFGNVMNMVVAVALLAMLLTGIGFGARSATASLTAGAAVAATANAWQLVLPVAALGCLPWALEFLRRGWREPRLWPGWIFMGVLTLNGLLGVRATSVSVASATISGYVSEPTVSNLFAPDWWWFAALALSAIAAVAAFRQGARLWAASVVCSVSGVVLLTGYLLRATGSTWDLMLYYPVKALWTGLIVTIPTAAVGALVVVAAAWRASSRRAPATALVLRTLVLGLVVLAVVGVAGRGAAFRPHLVVMGMGGDGMPNWSLAVIDAMEGTRLVADAHQEVVLMGVVPSTNVQGVIGGFVGMVDYLGMEALGHAGVDDAASSPVKWPLALRDSPQICQYLKENPGALRITGPNRAAGPEWMLQSGCPVSVVRPERWVTLVFESAWLDNSLWEDPSGWEYPTADEVEAARR